MRFIKKILERGTITIPSDVREALGVEEGDIVEFQVLRVVKRHGSEAEPKAPATRAAKVSAQAPPPAKNVSNGEA